VSMGFIRTWGTPHPPPQGGTGLRSARRPAFSLPLDGGGMGRGWGRTKVASMALAVFTTLASDAAGQTPRTPSEIVDAFHQALGFGDTARALSLLTRELVVYEFGLVDPTLQAYAFAHLPADMNMASQTQWALQTRRMGGTGD